MGGDQWTARQGEGDRPRTRGKVGQPPTTPLVDLGLRLSGELISCELIGVIIIIIIIIIIISAVGRAVGDALAEPRAPALLLVIGRSWTGRGWIGRGSIDR